MSLVQLHLALLSSGPAHGYDLKREYDAWFPDAKPLPFGQVYATLGRLVRDGLAEVVETRSEGGPERTVYSVTDAGRARLREWLAEPAPPAVSGTEDLVRKTVVALRTRDPDRPASAFVGAQQVLHEQQVNPPGADAETTDLSVQLVRRYTLLHHEADQRWLNEVAAALPRRARERSWPYEPPGPSEPRAPTTASTSTE